MTLLIRAIRVIRGCFKPEFQTATDSTNHTNVNARMEAERFPRDSCFQFLAVVNVRQVMSIRLLL
jgi:hypothetical protein